MVGFNHSTAAKKKGVNKGVVCFSMLQTRSNVSKISQATLTNRVLAAHTDLNFEETGPITDLCNL